MNWEVRLYTKNSSLQENEDFKLHLYQGHLKAPVRNMEVCVDGAQLIFLIKSKKREKVKNIGHLT